jgi:predicted kinase
MVFFGMTYGMAGSGKSLLTKFVQENNRFPTLSFHFPKNIHFEVVASDEVRLKIYKKQSLTEIFGGIDPEHNLPPDLEKEVWAVIKEKVTTNLGTNKDTLLDNTALMRTGREYVLQWLQECEHKYLISITRFLMVINTSYEQILKWNQPRSGSPRPAAVPQNIIDRMWLARNDPNQQPQLDAEKWDFIYYYEPERYPLK